MEHSAENTVGGIEKERIIKETAVEEKMKPVMPIRSEEALLVSKEAKELLIVIWKSAISLLELKLLHMYLAKLASGTQKTYLVTMKKKELQAALGISRVRTEHLEACLERLTKPIPLGEGKSIRLFETARWTMRRIDMVGTPELLKLYTKPMREQLAETVSEILPFNRRYTYILYRYLQIHKPDQPWAVEFAELRDILGYTNKALDLYRHFSDKILKVSYLEIWNKTNLRFTYDPIRIGRTVVQVQLLVMDSTKCQRPIEEDELTKNVIEESTKVEKPVEDTEEIENAQTEF